MIYKMVYAWNTNDVKTLKSELKVQLIIIVSQYTVEISSYML